MKKRVATLLLTVFLAMSSFNVFADETVNKVDTPEELEKITSTKLYPWLINHHSVTKAQINDGVKGGEGGQIPYTAAISHTNPDKILMGTDTSGIYYSTDGAVTWKKSEISPNGCINALGFYPLDDRYAFAHVSISSISKAGGIYRSTDGGDTWEQVFFLESDQKDIGSKGFGFGEADPVTGICPIYTFSPVWLDKNNPIAGATGLFRSDDLGETWYSIGNLTDVEIEDIYSSPYDNLDLVIAITANKDKAVLVSYDGGQTFIPKTNGMEYAAHSLAVDPLDPEKHWIVSSGDQWGSLTEEEKYDYFMEVLNSMDAWKDKTLEEKEAFIKEISVYGQEPVRYIDVSKCLYETTDGGENWELLTTDWTGGGKLDGFWDPAKRLRGYNTTSLGVSDITMLKYGYPYVDEETGEKKVRLYSQSCYVNFPFRYSDDNGRTWHFPERDTSYDFLATVSTGWFSELVAVTPANPKLVIAGLGVVYRSDDCGTSFYGANNGISGALAMDWYFHPETGQVVYTLVMDHGLRYHIPEYEWYTGDYPALMPTEGYTFQSCDKVAVDPNDPNHVFVITGIAPYGGTSTIAETFDNFKTVSVYKGMRDVFDARKAGKTENVGIGKGQAITFLEYSSTDDNVVYSSWFVSEDNGKNWRETEKRVMAVSYHDGDIAYSVDGDERSLYISYDRAKTWNDTGFDFPVVQSAVFADKFEPYVLWLGKHWDSTLYRLDLKNGNLKIMAKSNGIKSDSGAALQILQFAQNPKNKDHLAISCRDLYYDAEFLMESYDGGNSWDRIPAFGRAGGYVKFNPVKDQLWIGGCSGTWVYEYDVYNTIKKHGFMDNNQGNFAYDALKELGEKGIAEYDEDGYFYPDRAVTRAELADFVCSVMGYETANKTCDFSDVDKTHKYYESVAVAVENGIMTGGQTFRPDDAASYDEVAIVVLRMLNGKDTDTANAGDKCVANGIFDRNIVEGEYDKDAQVSRGKVAYVLKKVLDLKQ